MVRPDDISHSSGEQRGIAAGADHEDHGGLGMIGFGEIEIGTGGGLEIVTMDVFNDADNSSPLLNVAGLQAMANGALPGPFALGKETVDDGDVALAVVGAGEAAPFE